jgi:hypothetical protein
MRRALLAAGGLGALACSLALVLLARSDLALTREHDRQQVALLLAATRGAGGAPTSLPAPGPRPALAGLAERIASSADVRPLVESLLILSQQSSQSAWTATKFASMRPALREVVADEDAPDALRSQAANLYGLTFESEDTSRQSMRRAALAYRAAIVLDRTNEEAKINLERVLQTARLYGQPLELPQIDRSTRTRGLLDDLAPLRSGSSVKGDY